MSGLAGRGVVVTRPASQAGGLAARISQLGGRALLYPAMDIAPAPDSEMDAIAAGLDRFDLAVFISRNAVEFGAARVLQRRAWPEGLRLAAIGAGTRRALEDLGLGPVIAPVGLADSEALLALPEMASLAGRQVLVFRGEGGREFLAQTLRARSARVEYAECYRRCRPATDMQPLLTAWAAGDVDAIAFSSGQGLRNFVEITGSRVASLLARTPVFVPHPRVAEQARAAGARIVVTGGPSDAETAEALVAYFSVAR